MFEVSPWEVETDDYEFERVKTVEWRGKKWELALRRRPASDAHLAFRQLNGPLLFGYHTFHKNEPQPTQDEVFQIFIRLHKEEQWSRILYLNERFLPRRQGEECSFEAGLQLKGDGYFQRKKHPFLNPLARFHWDMNASKFLVSSSLDELMKRLEQEADSAFARRFLFMSEDERWGEVWNWKHGNHHEFKRVLELALLAQEELWQTETGLHLTLDVFRIGDDNNLGTMLYSDQYAIQDVNNPRPLPLALREGLETALAHFAPTLNIKHAERHLCLKKLLRPLSWTIQIKPRNPTAHERIEAALAWREWLAQTQSQ